MRSNRARRRSWAAVALLLGLLAVSLVPAEAAPARAQAAALERVGGTFVYAGGQRERDRLHAAIDSVVHASLEEEVAAPDNPRA